MVYVYESVRRILGFPSIAEQERGGSSTWTPTHQDVTITCQKFVKMIATLER